MNIPDDFSSESIGNFVNQTGVQFEQLQSLCLAMAAHIEKLGNSELDLIATIDNVNHDLSTVLALNQGGSNEAR